MKKRGIFLLVLIFLLAISITRGDEGDELTTEEFQELNDPEIIKDNIAGNPSLAKDLTDAQIATLDDEVADLPEEAIATIADRLSPEQVAIVLEEGVCNSACKAKLDANQISKNPDNIKNAGNLNDFNQNELGEAVQDLAQTNAPVTLENPTTGRVLPDNTVVIDSATKVGVGTVEIGNAQNIRINGPKIEVETADIVDFLGVGNEQVSNFDGDRTELTYFVGSAQKIQAGCFDARNVNNADISIQNGNVEINTPEGEEFDIVYGFDNQLDFTAGPNSVLVVDPSGCMKEFNLVGEHFVLDIPGQRTEIIEADDTAIITIDRELGFVCGQFNPPAKYSSQGATLEDIFSLVVWKTPHKICARKHVDQTFDIEKEMTLVDFLTSKITINGVADYRRYFFSNGALLTPTTIPHYTPEIPFTSILSHDPSWKKATASVASNDIQNTAVFSNFLKVFDQRENTKRFLVFDTKVQTVAENIIQNYQTISHPLIYVTDSIIVQDTNTQAKITILPPNHPDIQTSIKTFS